MALGQKNWKKSTLRVLLHLPSEGVNWGGFGGLNPLEVLGPLGFGSSSRLLNKPPKQNKKAE